MGRRYVRMRRTRLWLGKLQRSGKSVVSRKEWPMLLLSKRLIMLRKRRRLILLERKKIILMMPIVTTRKIPWGASLPTMKFTSTKTRSTRSPRPYPKLKKCWMNLQREPLSEYNCRYSTRSSRRSTRSTLPCWKWNGTRPGLYFGLREKIGLKRET